MLLLLKQNADYLMVDISSFQNKSCSRCIHLKLLYVFKLFHFLLNGFVIHLFAIKFLSIYYLHSVKNDVKDGLKFCFVWFNSK